MNPLFSLAALLTLLSIVVTTALLLVGLWMAGSDTERRPNE